MPHGNLGREHFQTQKALIKPSTQEIAWAAGFMEGEGYFGRGTRGPRIQVGQVNIEPLSWLLACFGGGIRFEDRSKKRDEGLNRKDCFYWHVDGSRARGILYTIYKFMSRNRQTQIRKALEIVP